MISSIDLFRVISSGYWNCYNFYFEVIQEENTIELRAALLHRMHIYYEILEMIYNSQYE